MGSYFDVVPNDPQRLILARVRMRLRFAAVLRAASCGYGFTRRFGPINPQREITVPLATP
jgi:hypothetical protein